VQESEPGTATRSFDPRIWGRWVAGFIGFPLAGLAARAVAGNIDDPRSALLGGLAAGAVLGGVQALALRRSVANRPAWVAATAAGMAVGLGVGATLVDFATDTSSLVVMGALSGLGVGLAQALVLRAGSVRRILWVVSNTTLWALGWWVTSMVIVDVERQHANFGASGALLATLLGGLVLAVRPDAA
jgi:hypothetical protein